MVGLTTATEAEVWVAADSGHIRLRYWPVGDPGKARRTPALHAEAAEQANLVFRITGLEPETRYQGQVIVDDRARQSFRLRTMPEAGTEADFSIALGSCSYLNDAATDGGRRYGGDPRIFRSIVAEKPEFMLWLGDNIYYRDSDLEGEPLMRRRQLRPRQESDMAFLFRSLPSIAIWDDHDYGPNDSDGSYERKARSRRVFRDFWPNRLYPEDENRGLYFRHQVGDVELFGLDGRYHRSPNETPDDAAKTMLGAEQFRWLVDGLRSSRARFKLIVFGGQVLNPLCRFEGMAKFSHERDRLIDAIGAHRIGGVLFLTGDRHHSELIVKERPGLYPLHDFTCSPLLSGTHGSQEKVNPARVPGSYVTERRNFGLLRFSGRGEDRQMRIEIRGVDGELYFAQVLRARDMD